MRYSKIRVFITGLCLVLLLGITGYFSGLFTEKSPEMTPPEDSTPEYSSQKDSTESPSDQSDLSSPQTPDTSPTPSQSIREIEGLVLLGDLDDSIIIELKYATEDNFINKPIYPVAVAVINRGTGERLVKANKIFNEKGYRVKVWDAYRPIYVQRLFWEAYPDSRYVARPPDMSKISTYRPSHMNGMSVDITLVDIEGKELEMPSEFDDFSERASVNYPHMSQKARENVDYLIEVMESVGFESYYGEWWHFNDITGEPIPYKDISLELFIK